MNLFVMNAVVIFAALQGVAPPGKSAAPPTLDAKSNPEAYAIYATVLQRAETRRTKTLLVQRETVSNAHMGCREVGPLAGEWADVAADFQHQNAVERTLQPVLPMKTRYRLIRRAAIQADDARLVKKHGTGWQRTPESLDYAAVSVIGFNRNRTKAILYVGKRNGGDVVRLELKGGSWVHPPEQGCLWRY